MLFMGAKAQNDFDNLLSAGLEDAERFVKDYARPGPEAVVFTLANGWYNDARVKPVGDFEISFIGGISAVNSNDHKFTLNQNDYNFLRFQEGPSVQEVSTILGQNSPDIIMNIVEGDQVLGSVSLPQGIDSKPIENLPNFIIQGSVGLPFSTELKLRFLPEVEHKEVTSQFFGIGLQHEFTNWIPSFKVLPIAVSGFIGYNKFEGEYKFSEQSSFLSASNQTISSDIDAWHYALLVSTKLPVVNFYGSLGSAFGSSDSILVGDELADPIKFDSSVNGFRATLGAKLTLGFFRLNIDYSFQEFNSLNAGINFGI